MNQPINECTCLSPFDSLNPGPHHSLQCPRYVPPQRDLVRELRMSNERGVHPPQDWTTRAIEEIERLAAESDARHQSCLVLMKSVEDYRAELKLLRKALEKIRDSRGTDPRLLDIAGKALRPADETEAK